MATSLNAPANQSTSLGLRCNLCAISTVLFERVGLAARTRRGFRVTCGERHIIEANAAPIVELARGCRFSRRLGRRADTPGRVILVGLAVRTRRGRFFLWQWGASDCPSRLLGDLRLQTASARHGPRGWRIDRSSAITRPRLESQRVNTRPRRLISCGPKLSRPRPVNVAGRRVAPLRVGPWPAPPERAEPAAGALSRYKRWPSRPRQLSQPWRGRPPLGRVV
jgi:hypothetical protein